MFAAPSVIWFSPLTLLRVFSCFLNHSVELLATPYRDPLGVEAPGTALLPVWVGAAGAL